LQVPYRTSPLLGELAKFADRSNSRKEYQN
jgi:hypothetical protein